MTTRITDRAKHHFPIGFSVVSERLADERLYTRDRLLAAPAIIVPPTYDELRYQIDELLAKVASLQTQLATASPKSQRRTSYSNKQRGRQRAESVIMQNRITYYSQEHVAKLAGLHISSVSRQIDKLGIKSTVIGGIKYIPAAQASNIKKKRARH